METTQRWDREAREGLVVADPAAFAQAGRQWISRWGGDDSLARQYRAEALRRLAEGGYRSEAAIAALGRLVWDAHVLATEAQAAERAGVEPELIRQYILDRGRGWGHGLVAVWDHEIPRPSLDEVRDVGGGLRVAWTRPYGSPSLGRAHRVRAAL